MAKRFKDNSSDQNDGEDIEALRKEMTLITNEIKRLHSVITAYEKRIHVLETKAIVNNGVHGSLGTIIPTLGQITFK